MGIAQSALRASAICLLALTSCHYFMPSAPCPPPPSAKVPVTDTYSCDSATVEAYIPSPITALPLWELVDIALQNSPKTRAAWYRAKLAATQVGTARGAYLPPVMFTATWLQDQLSQINLNLVSLNWTKQVSFGFTTSYLLYDFGGRNAQLCMALAALAESNWLYNWDIQSVILTVVQSYYHYVNALGKKQAEEANVNNFLETVEAATALRATGIKGVSDELQAKTQMYRSQIALEETKLAVDIAYATLLNALGLSQDISLTIADLPDKIETAGVCEDMKMIMQMAKVHRADLMAARAVVVEQREKIRLARSDFLPTLTADAFGGRVSLSDMRFLDNFELQFNINVPLFSSFADINALRAAQANLFEAQANLDNAELKAYLEVISDYYEFIANTNILKYSCNYLEVATKNQESAFANYEIGLATIIDVLLANNALNTARMQLVDAKTNFLTALANLSFDTGGLSFESIRSDQTVHPALVETSEVMGFEDPCPNPPAASHLLP